MTNSKHIFIEATQRDSAGYVYIYIYMLCNNNNSRRGGQELRKRSMKGVGAGSGIGGNYVNIIDRYEFLKQ